MKMPKLPILTKIPVILDSFLNSDPSLSVIGVLTGIVGVALAQFLRSQDPSSWVPSVLLIIGLGFFGPSLLFIASKKKLSTVFHRPMGWLGISSVQIVLLISAPILGAAAYLIAGNDVLMRQPALAVSLWLISILCVILGFRSKSSPRPRLQRIDALIALGMFLLALVLRSIDTAHLPLALSGDEASAGLSSVDVLNGLQNNIFGTGWFSFPRLFFVLQALSIRIFGQTTPGLRLLSALGGALTVGALYLLARGLFNRWSALACGVFMAFFHFHIHFSRIGLNNIWDGLFFTLSIGLLWGGWKYHSRLYFIFSGVCLGLGQYFYTSSRMLVLLIALIYLGLGIVGRPSDLVEAKPLFRRLGALVPNLLIIYWSAAIVFLPLGLFFLHAPDEFMAPMNRVNLTADWFNVTAANLNTSYAGVMLNQVLLSVRAYTEIPPREWYDSDTPILLTIPSIFFYLGIVILLVRKNWAQAWLVLVWLGSISLVGALSQDTPTAQRYIAATPVLALIVGGGVTGVCALFAQLWPSRRTVWTVLSVLILIWISWNEFDQYFINFAHRSFFDDNTQTAQILANYLQNKPAGTAVNFLGTKNMGYNSINSLPYLAPQVNFVDCPVPFDTQNCAAPAQKNTVFAVLPDNEGELKAIQAVYPGGVLKHFSGAYPQTLLWVYDVTLKTK